VYAKITSCECGSCPISGGCEMQSGAGTPQR
jgi:hypothetical protein